MHVTIHPPLASSSVCRMPELNPRPNQTKRLASSDQGFISRPVTGNRRAPVPIYRTGLTGYRSEPVEFKSKFRSSRATGSDRFTGRFDRFTGRFYRFIGRFDRFEFKSKFKSSRATGLPAGLTGLPTDLTGLTGGS